MGLGERFVAWQLSRLDGYMHRKFGAIKMRFLDRVPASVVEIGPGSGINFRYYPRGTEIVAIEPNRELHERLKTRAEQFGIRLDLHADGAETMKIDSGSADLVFASLVLCSASDPRAVVREVRRILKPGGRFVCIEHVPAPADSILGRLQRLLRRPWRAIFGGCDLRNETEAILSSAGFASADIERMRISGVVPVRDYIAARCSA